MIALALQAATAFNLLCSGTIIDVRPGDPSSLVNPVTRPFVMEFRVDLDRGRWCFHDACDISFPIASVTDTQIVLMSSEDRSARPTGRYIEANRENGEFLMRSGHIQTIEVRRGTCERRPSPGLPSRRF